MNQTLDSSIDPNSERFFSMQSEHEIWRIAAFWIPKESNKILSWVFSQTKLPSLIDIQEKGQMLEVTRLGSFKVELHMATSMKTIKCMYGLSMRANCPFNCIYCNQQRQKSMIGTVDQAKVVMKEKMKYSWTHSLFSRFCGGHNCYWDTRGRSQFCRSLQTMFTFVHYIAWIES